MKNLFIRLALLVGVGFLCPILGMAAPLSGTYTVDATSTASNNYTSVAAAVSDLYSQGVNGAVTFVIADGTYTGQVSFNGAITGASSTNSILFKSKSADASKAIITNTGTYTVFMSAADYVSFEDLTVRTTQTGTRYVVYLTANADHNRFERCVIEGPRNTSYSSYSVYCYQSEFNTWKDCKVDGNYWGFRFYGWSDSNCAEDNVVDGCEVSGHYYYGIYAYYQDGITIKSCTVDSAQTGIGYGLYHYRSHSSLIDANTFNTGYYPLYIGYSNYYYTGDTIRVHNNSAGNGRYYGAFNTRTDMINYYHNSFEGNDRYEGFRVTNYGQDDIRVANNIFVSDGAYYGLYVYLGGTSYSPLYWDHNDYWFKNYSYFAYFNGSFATTFTAYKALFSGAYNQNSLDEDPGWSGLDRRTRSNLLNNKGVPVGVNKDIDGNQRPNTLDGKVDIGPNDFYLPPYSLDILALKSPLPVVVGTNTITGTFKNSGSKTITSKSLDIEYSVDGGTNWVKEKLSIASLAPGATIDFSFSKTWSNSTTGKFVVSLRFDDATFGTKRKDFNVCTGLSGIYTVGSGKDYSTIEDAIDDLGCGVSGAVVFEISSGTYNTTLELNEVHGASATNTITLKGLGTAVITNSSGANTLEMDGADYFHFENLTIEATGSNGYAVHMMNEANYNVFDGCEIKASPTTYSSLSAAVMMSSDPGSAYSYGNTGNFNVFKDNDMSGGYFTVRINGASTTAPTEGNQFYNNSIENAYYYGLYTYYQDGLIVYENSISNLRRVNSYGIISIYSSNFRIESNHSESGYGDQISYSNNFNWNGIDLSTYANNTLICDYLYANGLYGYRSSNVGIWHNSIYSKGRYCVYTSYGTNVDLRNNIFFHDGTTGYAVYAIGVSFSEWDYNDYVVGSVPVAYTGTAYADIAALTSYNLDYNQNNFDEDPNWVKNGVDHHITGAFPQTLIGARVGITEDADGDARCTFAPTLGVDEFKRFTPSPRADFLKPDTAWLDDHTTLINSNKSSDQALFTWFVNGKEVSNEVHLSYFTKRAGLDTIMLVVENCGGVDTMVKTMLVHKILRAPKADIGATKTTVYTGEDLGLIDLSEYGAHKWDWSVSPSTGFSRFIGWTIPTFTGVMTDPNPIISFDLPGVYTIKLVVENVFGKDSIERILYITVKEKATMCNLPYEADGTPGTLFDMGGPSLPYSAGLNGVNRCEYLISSCKGDVKLDVTSFDLGDDDYLRIYDGTDNTGTPLWDIAKFPNGMTGTMAHKSVKKAMRAITGSAFFVFESDNSASTVGDGFAIDWDIIPVVKSNPTADFVLKDTVCLGYRADFANSSIGFYNESEWDIDDNGTIESYNKDFSYTFNTAGTFDIQLLILNPCGGKDSIVKKVVVESPSRRSVPSMLASDTLFDVGDTLVLTGSADYCYDSVRWEISPKDYVVSGGTLKDQEVGVTFTRGGKYTVKFYTINPSGSRKIEKVDYIRVLNYCIPAVAVTGTDMGITRVAIGSIDNTSDVSADGYTSYRHLSTTVERGHSYPITMERATAISDMTRRVWIDWNRDGDFNDAHELVASEPASKSLVFNDTILVPPASRPGTTRMRVGVGFKNQKNEPCGPNRFGEYEEYTINILERDLTAPRITLVTPIDAVIEVFDTWTEPGYSASDLVEGNLTSQVTITNGINNKRVGTYEVWYRVKDSSGNADSVKRVVEVVDTKIPELTLVGQPTKWVQIFSAYSDSGYVAKDAYDQNLAVSTLSDLDLNTLGTYTITYCTTDSSGNGPVCATRTITVGDTIYPTLSILGDNPLQVEVKSQFTDPGVTVSDNHSYELSKTGTFNENTDVLGEYTIVYTAVDPSGNLVSVTRIVEVVDTQAPIIELEGDLRVTVERWADYSDAGYNVQDNYYSVAEITVDTAGTFVNTQSIGAYTITYTATDASGNVSATVQRLVEVIETGTGIPPVERSAISIYPNPSGGQFNVAFAEGFEGQVSIKVLDLAGKQVFTTSGNGNASLIQLNLSELATGTYYMDIATKSTRSIEKIIISR